MTTRPDDRDARVGQLFEKLIRLGVGLGLLAWCGLILAPFLHALLWGVLLAVVLAPLFRKLAGTLGGSRKAAALVLALVGISAVLVPAIALAASLLDGVEQVHGQFEAGEVDLPPPPASVADWPVVGKTVHGLWASGAEDIESLAEPLAPHLKRLAGVVLSIAGSLAGAVFQAIVALVIAVALLVHVDWSTRVSTAFAGKLAGRRGGEMLDLARVTIRGVARGILGVALIQATLAGLGFAVVGIPGAGLWALVCLLCCIVQLPAALVLIPTVLYVFSVESTTTATIYAVWAVAVGLSDNVIKPFMFGDQVRTPVLVLLIGSIGGLLLSGVIGLFTGAVVLALGYELTFAWVNSPRTDADAEAPEGDADDSPPDDAVPAPAPG